MPWKTGGGGGGAQSNFPTHDHQNIFNLILFFLENILFWGVLGAPVGATAMQYIFLG